MDTFNAQILLQLLNPCSSRRDSLNTYSYELLFCQKFSRFNIKANVPAGKSTKIANEILIYLSSSDFVFSLSSLGSVPICRIFESRILDRVLKERIERGKKIGFDKRWCRQSSEISSSGPTKRSM